ncbi:hypothetical protein Pst134EB_008882 [Puccinia striiformis f. sp. tritici]|nr:hypothetical protein Pst134EB_008882 [Puccinia striiformis f. sp. tritici]
MRFFNFAAIFGVLFHASLVIGLPQTTTDPAANGGGQMDLLSTFMSISVAAQTGDPTQVYALVGGLLEFDVQQAGSTGGGAGGGPAAREKT